MEIQNVIDIALQENELDHIKLAKISGFNDKEIEMVRLFWEPAFNKNWLLITSELVHDQLGYKKTESSLRDLYKKMKEFYKEEIEYKEVDKNHEIVEFYYKNLPGNISRQESRGGSNKKYYIITGETFKKMCMRANTIKGNETCDYFIKVESLCNIMSKYLIEKFKIEQQKQLEKQQKELEKQTKALQIAESKNLQLTSFIKENAVVKEDGWFYVATTRQYSQNNIYKIGKTEKLNPRMGNYQTGRSKSDAYYYVYIYKTCKMSLLETLLKKLLEKYKEDKKKELFVLPWKLLHEYVDYICSNFNECFIYELNQLITDNLDYGNRNEVPEIPEPLDLSQSLVEQNTDLEFEEEIEDDVEEENEEKIIKNEDDESGFASDDDTVENNEIIKSIESNSNVSSSSSNKDIKIKTKECYASKSNYHRAPIDEFYITKDGYVTSICLSCINNKLNIFKEKVLFMLNSTPKNYKTLKLKTLKNLLKHVSCHDIFKRKDLRELGNYRRCNSNKHKKEIDRWQDKSFYYINPRDKTLFSYCNDCR